MFFNNDFYLDGNIKKKVQNNTKYLFPKITILSSSTNHKQKVKNQSLPISEKDLQFKRNSQHFTIKDHANMKEKLFSINPKDILTSNKHFYLENNQKTNKNTNQMQANLYKIEPIKYDTQMQKKLRKTQREINQFRRTYMPQKSQNLSPFQMVNIKENTTNNKKSISHYMIIKQLGHGGFATVYEVTDKNTDINYALKEYNLTESFQCYQNQVKVGEYFKNNPSRSKLEQKITQPIVKYIQKIRIGKKGYIIQQLAGQCLSKLISEIKGVFYNKQRVYEVRFLPFYQQLKKRDYFVSVMTQICQGIETLNNAGFVHCDLKLQNIMVNQQENEHNDTPKVKIIDFGSTFQSAKGIPKITITPEYMPPELLTQFTKNNVQPTEIIYQKIDVWSIGCIMLQIFTGIPLWFKYKCKLTYNDKNRLDLSIFALTNRDYAKVIKKQYELCGNLIKSISFVSQEWEKYRGLLREIFVIDPVKRISVQELIKKLNSTK